MHLYRPRTPPTKTVLRKDVRYYPTRKFLHNTIFHNKMTSLNTVNHALIVCHYHHSALALFNSVLYFLNKIHTQMVSGLIHQQNLRRMRHQENQRHPALLSQGKVTDRAL